LPGQLLSYFVFALVVVLSTLLYFFIGNLTSCFAFWTEEVWATRWLFGIVFLELMSGIFFPLDVLPSFLAKIISFTPFPYLVYYPLKIWNQGVVGMETFKIMGILTFWLLVSLFLRNKIWKKGMKRFAAYGN